MRLSLNCVIFSKNMTLHVSDIEILEEHVKRILCKLERISPPIIFDIMVHLVLHLPQEPLLGGPVHFRSIYSVK